AVAAVDLATQTVVGKAAVGDGPVQVYVTPDGSALLVANQGSEESPSTTLSLVDAATLVETGTVETGAGAHGVVVEPNGRYAYVTNLYADTMAVVALESLTLVASVPTGESPNGVSFSMLPPAAAATPEIVLPLPVHEEDADAGHTEEGDAGEHEGHH
ncbi:MAG: hypothetical protein DCC57_22170, partial [Chloroflexi bacterium]